LINKLNWYYYRYSSFERGETVWRLKRFIDILYWFFIWVKRDKNLNINTNFKEYPCEIYGKTILITKRIYWASDNKNNKLAPSRFVFFYNKNNFEDVGELKFTNELSRFTWYPEYLKTLDKNDYPSAKNIIYHWFSQNQFLNSFLWLDGIEVGLRTYHILVALKKNKKIDMIDNNNYILINYIKCCESWLTKRLSLYSSANNHLIAELLGLVSIYYYTEKYDLIPNLLNKYIGYIDNQFHQDGWTTEESITYGKDTSIMLDSILKLCSEVHIRFPKIGYLQNKINSINLIIEHLNSYGFEIGDNDKSIIINYESF